MLLAMASYFLTSEIIPSNLNRDDSEDKGRIGFKRISTLISPRNKAITRGMEKASL